MASGGGVDNFSVSIRRQADFYKISSRRPGAVTQRNTHCLARLKTKQNKTLPLSEEQIGYGERGGGEMGEKEEGGYWDWHVKNKLKKINLKRHLSARVFYLHVDVSSVLCALCPLMLEDGSGTVVSYKLLPGCQKSSPGTLERATSTLNG